MNQQRKKYLMIAIIAFIAVLVVQLSIAFIARKKSDRVASDFNRVDSLMKMANDSVLPNGGVGGFK
jgi:hypothetical protein